MKKGNKNIPAQPDNIISEPETIYSKKSLRTFSSLEDMNEADAKEMANISAIEHLRNACKLTKRIFFEELNKKMSKSIKFR